MKIARKRFPEWLRKSIPANSTNDVENIIADLGLNTVCKSALCPNRCECYAKKRATFMILGNICTRSCRFCSVEQGIPQPVDPDEPEKIAQAVRKLNLQYAVVTCVSRDD